MLITMLCPNCKRMPRLLVDKPFSVMFRGPESADARRFAEKTANDFKCKCGRVGLWPMQKNDVFLFSTFDAKGYVPAHVAGRNKPWLAEHGYIKPTITWDSASERYACRWPRVGCTMMVVAKTPAEAYAEWLEQWVAGYGWV